MTERPDPPYDADERATLTGFLDFQRATLAWKCEGLDAEQLARRASPPSGLSLLGLLRHLAEVERGWFDRIADRNRPDQYSTAEIPDLDLTGAVADPEMVRLAYADWRTAIAESDEVLAAAQLGDTFAHDRTGEAISTRWVLAHMIEEYSRHNGHADLLREAIDGATGE